MNKLCIIFSSLFVALSVVAAEQDRFVDQDEEVAPGNTDENSLDNSALYLDENGNYFEWGSIGKTLASGAKTAGSGLLTGAKTLGKTAVAGAKAFAKTDLAKALASSFTKAALSVADTLVQRLAAKLQEKLVEKIKLKKELKDAAGPDKGDSDEASAELLTVAAECLKADSVEDDCAEAYMKLMEHCKDDPDEACAAATKKIEKLFE